MDSIPGRAKRPRTPMIAGVTAGVIALTAGLFITGGAQSGQVLAASSGEKIPAAGQATATTCYDPATTVGGFSFSVDNTATSLLITAVNIRLQDPTNSTAGACAGWTFSANLVDSTGAVLATSTGTMSSTDPALAFGIGTSFTGINFTNAADVTYEISKGA